VWHLDESAGPCRDSTRSGNEARPVNGVGVGAAGVIGTGAKFDGDDDELVLSKILPVGLSDNSVVLWLRVPRTGTAGLAASERVGIVLGNFPDRPCANWELHGKGQMRLYWNAGQVDQFGTTDVRDDAWHHLAWVRSRTGNKISFYLDGGLERTIDSAGDDIVFTTPHRIGGDNRGKPPNFHGDMDELRVSTVARSADWIRACWKNQRAPDAFATWSAVERVIPRE
jgi:hypothetical protein